MFIVRLVFGNVIVVFISMVEFNACDSKNMLLSGSSITVGSVALGGWFRINLIPRSSIPFTDVARATAVCVTFGNTVSQKYRRS